MPVTTMSNKKKNKNKNKHLNHLIREGTHYTGGDTHKTGGYTFIGLIGHEATVFSVDG
jgi:hypothetical protein